MKKIKLIVISIVIIFSLFLLTACANTSNAETESEKQFIKISDEGIFCIYYHKRTKVMYAVSNGYYNYGTMTLLVDSEGKPLLYEGEEQCK